MRSLRTVVAFVIAGCVSGPALAAPKTCKPCIEDSKALLSAIESGKAPAAKLIAAAETHTKGQAVGLVCSWVKGAWDAKVYTVAEGKVHAVSLDAAGAVTKAEEAKGMEALLDVAKAMSDAKITLTQVVEAADKRSRGKTLAVVARMNDGEAAFDCFCANEGVSQVSVNAAGKAGGVVEAEALPGEGHAAHPAKPKPRPAG